MQVNYSNRNFNDTLTYIIWSEDGSSAACIALVLFTATWLSLRAQTQTVQ